MKNLLKLFITSIIIFAVVISCVACDGLSFSQNNDEVVKPTESEKTYTVSTKPTLTSKGTIVSTDGDSVELPALNAEDYYVSTTVAATCSTQGKAEYLWKTTSYGEFSFEVDIPIDSSAHTYKVTENIAATPTQSGSRTYTCDKCGNSYVQSVEYSEYDATAPTEIFFAGDDVVVDNDNGGVVCEGTKVSIVTAGEYDLSGNADEGNITISVEGSVTLNLKGLTLSSSTSAVIYVENAEDVEISAKKDTANVLTDSRSTGDEDAEGGAIYALCDLELKGNGSLSVISSYNNGVHGKDDLKIKNLTLYVKAINNAIKGNDSITITSGCITAISVGGDALKTSNSSLSSKGKQKGNITISGGTMNLYAACDGIDAAYDAIISEDSAETVVNIFTDKYSEYSGEVTAISENQLYIRNTTSLYSYSVLFINDDGEEKWVNAEYHTSVYSGGMGGRTYYYYKVNKPAGYKNLTVYAYTSNQIQGTEDAYSSKSMTLNTSYDTIVFSNGNYSGWSNYTTQSSGGMQFGQMNDGNKDKGDYSTKGIKASNEITISSGKITITAYDDAIHANVETLENGASGKGSVNVSGGELKLSSNDDAIHADTSLIISGGKINISKSYEGLEGVTLSISGGEVYVVASDDGLNASGTSPSITISGGYVDITLGSGDVDGIDSNGSFTMTGGTVVTRGAPNGTSNMATGLDCDGTVKISGGTFVQFGAIETTPTLSGCYTLRFGTSSSSGGFRRGGFGGGSIDTSYSFKAGEWTISGLDLTITNAYTYYGCTIYSSALVKGSSYTISSNGTTYTATAS